VFGYKVFTLNPELLSRFDWAMELYPYSYKAFAQAQIIFGFLAIICVLYARLGTSWLTSFIMVYLLSFFSEFSGTSWGLPFGHYEYTDLLGAKILGKVPWLIPMSWFFMGLSSYRLAIWMLDRMGHVSTVLARCTRLLVATLVLLLWDVTLDPAMSHSTPFWVWEQPGSYYGMPALNIFGWAVTGFVIMGAFELLLGALQASRLPLGFMMGLYAVNLILSLGLLAAAGAWPPILITVVAAWALLSISRFMSARFGDRPAWSPIPGPPASRTPS
jgi:putative membrane protein